MQRDKAHPSLIFTPEEAREREAKLAASHGVPIPKEDEVGQGESEFPESGDGFSRIRGQIRASWIVSPSDGRVPYRPEVRARLRAAPELFDNPEERPTSERCLSSNGSSPPQVPQQDANLVQIVQTRDHLAIVSEKNHDVRVFPIGAPRDPRQPASWSGDSVARWEGRTLVVETQNFREKQLDRDFFFHSGAAKITERFTRVSPTELFYEFTVVDPAFLIQPLRAEMLFKAAEGPLFEYACHEGNYSLPTILQAARLGRQEAPKPATPVPAVATPTPVSAK